MRPQIIYILILLALLGIVPVYAQPNTLGLSDEDFMLLRNASRSTEKLFTFDFITRLSVEGLDTFAIYANLTGSVMVNLASPALDVVVKGMRTVNTSQTTPINTEVRWVDDTLYFNPGDGWQSMKPASTFLADAIGQYMGLSADESAMKTWDISGIVGLDSVLMPLMTIDPQTFLTANRLDDVTSDGQAKAAYFRLTADVQKLMQTDGFVDMVAAFAQAQGNDLVILDHAKLAAVVKANSAMFKGSTFVINEIVGLSDRKVDAIGLNLNMLIDPSVGGYPDAPFNVSWDLALNRITSQTNVGVSADYLSKWIPKPDSAKMVTAFEFPAPASLEAVAQGVTQYEFFETVGENASYSKSFEAKAGDTVTVTVRGLGLEFDSSAKLLAPDGKTLAEDDDHETNAFGVNPPDPQIADFKIDKDGTYQVEVNELDGAAGSFVLTITVKR